MPTDSAFELAPRLAADTLPVGDLPLCRVLLMNDARYPWLILVPRVAGIEELDQLDGAQRSQLMDDVAMASRALRAGGGVDKINVGALGNIVRQLHVHVVARMAGDDAWPGPVWGHGAARAYDEVRAADDLSRLRGRLADLAGPAAGFTPARD